MYMGGIIMRILKITDFYTIVGDDFPEMVVDTFFANLANNIGDEYAVYYEKETSRFKIIYKGIIWYLLFEKKVIESYEFGEFDYYTNRLNELIKKTNLYNSKKEQQQAIEERKKQKIAASVQEARRLQQVFADCERGNLPTSHTDLEAYLTHLKKGQKFSITSLGEYLSDFVWRFTDILYNKSEEVEEWLNKKLERLDKKSNLFNRLNIWGDDILINSLKISVLIVIAEILLLIVTLIPTFLFPSLLEILGGQLFINKMSKIMLWMLGGNVLTLLPWEFVLGMTFGSLIKEYKEYRYLINHKITEIERLLLCYSPSKKLTEIQVELFPNLQEAIESCEINDFIILEFYKLLNMAKHLNDSDKERLENIILSYTEAYKDEKVEIQQNDLKNELRRKGTQYSLKSVEDILNSKTKLGLELKYIEIINDLEEEIRGIRKIDIANRQLQNDLNHFLRDTSQDLKKPMYRFRHISGYQYCDTSKVYIPDLADPKTVVTLKRVRQGKE